jgi:RNA polymerase sigma-70 factor (ECF subfamily)
MGGQEPDREERWRGWMAAAQDGDAGAYQRLLAELLPFVRSIVRALLRDDPAVEDTVQEVLLSIHTARHTWRRERALTPWVRAITRNAVVDHARRRRRARAREAPVEAADLAGELLPAEERALSPGLERALHGLPDGQRQAVVWLKVEGLSVAEAARRAGVSEGAIKLRAHRGYRALRDLLGRERW